MLNRRELLRCSLLGLGATACRVRPRPSSGPVLNDVHSALNATQVARVVRPTSIDDVVRAVRGARLEGRAVSIAGARHAMGGQQFGTDTVNLDMTGLDHVLTLDPTRGLVTVEAGITWPAVIDELARRQAGSPSGWGIVQKQTGADRFTIGGALAANIHGRGLRHRPFVQDVESFDLVDANGAVRTCSRRENADLFRLAIGGYGLVGVVATVTLRLTPRVKVRRIVELLDVADVERGFAARIADGCTFGDFQFATDPARALRHGVFSCYRPVPDDTPIRDGQRELADDEWRELLVLAHVDKARAFDVYARHYRATDGQVYWSDTHQLSTYFDGYHTAVDARVRATGRASEMISELYVPRHALADFLDAVRREIARRRMDVIYGTVRLIERDDETLLAWARAPWACTVLNLHVEHTPAGVAGARDAFRALIDLARERGGTYYLTYHRWATRDQADACHPALRAFLEAKRAHDPEERFQSDWYRHHAAMLG